MLLNIKLENGYLTDTDREAATALGIPEADIVAAEVIAEKLRERTIIRERIEKEAGDIPSLLGTTSDAATIAVLVAAVFMASLEKDAGFSVFREKATGLMAQIAGEQDPNEIANLFLEKVLSGELRFPAMEKGIVTVLAEVMQRGPAVADAMYPEPEGE